MSNLGASNSITNYFWSTPPQKVFQDLTDDKVGRFALSIIKTATVTALVSVSTVLAGTMFFVQCIPFVFRSVPQSVPFLVVGNILGSITTGVAIANNKKRLAVVLGSATILAGLTYATLASVSFPLFMTVMTAQTLISFTVSLFLKATKTQKLALRSLFAIGFGLAGVMIGDMISSQIYLGVLSGALIGAAISAIAATGSMIAKRNGLTNLSKIASTIAIVSSLAVLLGLIAGVNCRAGTIGLFGGKLPDYAYQLDKPLIEVFKAGAHFQTKELATAAVATTAGVGAIANSGNVGKNVKDFLGSFIGTAFISVPLSAILGEGPLLCYLPLILMTGMINATGTIAANEASGIEKSSPKRLFQGVTNFLSN